MICRRGYRFRLKPTTAEEAAFRRFAGCCRFVWNELVIANAQRLEIGRRAMSYAEMCRCLTALKAKHPFLREPSASSLQQTLRDLSVAYARMRNPKLAAGAPRLKKRQHRIGVRFPAGFRFNGHGVCLPKVGWIGFRKSRAIEGRVKNVTVRFDGVHWYVSMQVEKEIADPIHQSKSAVGIDVGIEHFAALSDGSYIDGPNALKKYLAQIKRLQRNMTRKQQYSNNWRKAKLKLSRVYRRIAHIRNDATHKASSTISKNHAIVVLENLHIRNMVASAAGTLGLPGKHVRAKSALNRRILDQGWGYFRQQLHYKCAWRGGKVLLVDARDTSLTCSECSHVSDANRKTQARFECVRCGHLMHADTNASINVLRRAGLGPDSLWREAVTPLNEAGSSACAPGAGGQSDDFALSRMPNHSVPMQAREAEN